MNSLLQTLHYNIDGSEYDRLLQIGVDGNILDGCRTFRREGHRVAAIKGDILRAQAVIVDQSR